MNDAVTNAGVVDAISGQAPALQVTYTGTLQYPLMCFGPSTASVLDVTGTPGDGASHEVTSLRAGVGCNTIYYQEVSWYPGGGLITLSLDNLRWTAGYPVSFQSGTNYNALTTLRFPALTHCGSSLFSMAAGSVPVLATLDFPELLFCTSGFNASIQMPAITTFNVPKLQYCAGTVLSLSSGLSPLLTSLSFPALITAYQVFNTGATTANLASISAPLLKCTGATSLISVSGAQTSLTTLNFPSLTHCIGGLAPGGTFPALTTLTLSPIGTLKQFGGNLVISGSALSTASVNGLLQLFASLDGSNGTVRFGKGLQFVISGGTAGAPTFTGTTKVTTAIAVSAPDAYAVTASTTPDAWGYYARNGSYNGQNRYTSELGDYEIWYETSSNKWTVSPSAGDKSGPYWQTAAAGAITASYTAYGMYHGTATVTSITPVVCVLATATIASHGYNVGDLITVAGATPAGHNGTFRVASVTDANTITYYIPATTTIATVQATSVKRTSATEGYKYLQQIANRGATVTTN